MSNPKDILQRIDSEAMTREDIAAALSSVSKDAFLDHELQRLGFWDPNNLNETERSIANLEEKCDVLRARLVELQSDQSKKADAQKRLEAKKKKDKDEAFAKRKAKQKAKEQKRLEKIARWKEIQKSDIIYLGKGVSSLLGAAQQSIPKLVYNRVPQLSTMSELADLLELDVARLRRLAYHRKVSRYSQYIRFSIPKKTGGVRSISAPHPGLKRAQQLILEKILKGVPLHDAAHGFIKGRSIVSNALPHVGQSIVINMDLQDFFPTFTFKRVRGCFISLGYSPRIATVLALLCTEADCGTVKIDGQL